MLALKEKASIHFILTEDEELRVQRQGDDSDLAIMIALAIKLNVDIRKTIIQAVALHCMRTRVDCGKLIDSINT